MNAQAIAARDRAQRKRRLTLSLWQGAAVLSLAFALIGWAGFYRLASSTWRSDQAPPMQRVYVVTEGFTDRQGQWRSFDTGERITVKHWTP